MIILGLICLIAGYLIPLGILVTIGWILIVLGIALLLLSFVANSPVHGRRFY